MSPGRLQRRAGRPIAIALASALAGCATSSPQTAATTWVREHLAGAARVAAAVKADELGLAQLPVRPTRAQLTRLLRSVRAGRGDVVAAAEWQPVSVSAASAEEGGEEEDIPRAENQATQGASELAAALSALQLYALAPSAKALASYRSDLAAGREQWNEGIAQLWHLAHVSNAPVI
jgi:hypothetical protein